MSQRSLVERLMAADTATRPASAVGLSPGLSDKSEMVDSVMANLRTILNSRAGCCQIRPDYGMPDFNELVGRFPDAIAIVANSVRSEIEVFEPRLSNVAVRHVPDRSNPLRLAFHITAALIVDDELQRLSFETVLNNDGYVNVTG